MIFVEKLGIQNYNCFRHFEIVFNEHLNIIVGNNEEGKSTILEALHLCLTGGKAYAQHREQSSYDCFFSYSLSYFSQSQYSDRPFTTRCLKLKR